MAREPWAKKPRNFIYDALSESLSQWSSNQIALTAEFEHNEADRLVKEGIIERQAGSTLFRFGESFLMRSVATLMEKFLPGEKETAEARKSGRVRRPEYLCLSVLKQALKTMRAELEDGLIDYRPIREVWANLCINDEGFFLIPSAVFFEPDGAQTCFTAAELERYRVSLEPTGE